MGYRLNPADKARRAAERAALVNPYKPGDIVYRTWGYEQTNADFYRVVATTPKAVRIEPLRAIETEHRPFAMSGHAVPDLEAPPTGPAQLKRLVVGRDGTGEAAVRIDSYSSAIRWHGRPVGISWYA